MNQSKENALFWWREANMKMVALVCLQISANHIKHGLWVTDWKGCNHHGSPYADTPTLYLSPISLPPLHASKLRNNFVSLQRFQPSTVPVACHPVSARCRDSALLMLQWMTNQGHASSPSGFSTVTALKNADAIPADFCVVREGKRKSQHAFLKHNLPFWMMLKQVQSA